MLFGCKKIEKGLTDFVGFHGAGMGGLLESVEDAFSHLLTAYRFSRLGRYPRYEVRNGWFP